MSHHADFGVIKDVAVIHPHARTVIKLHCQFQFGMLRHIDRILPFQHTLDRVQHLKEEAVHVKRVREVGVVAHSPYLGCTHLGDDRYGMFVMHTVDAHADVVVLVIANRQVECLLFGTRDVERSDITAQ